METPASLKFSKRAGWASTNFSSIRASGLKKSIIFAFLCKVLGDADRLLSENSPSTAVMPTVSENTSETLTPNMSTISVKDVFALFDKNETTFPSSRTRKTASELINFITAAEVWFSAKSPMSVSSTDFDWTRFERNSVLKKCKRSPTLRSNKACF